MATHQEHRQPQLVGAVSGGLAGDFEVRVHQPTDPEEHGWISIEGTEDLEHQSLSIPSWAIEDLAGILLAARGRFSGAQL